MEQYQNNTIDFMNLMKDWYTQSGDLFKFMLNTFSMQPDNDLPGDRKGPVKSEHGEKGTWHEYSKNMDSLIKELAATYNFNQKLMENLNEKWKDFQNSVGKYFSAYPEIIQGNESQDEIWSKWFEYQNIINRQLMDYYNNLFSSIPEPSTSEQTENPNSIPINQGTAFFSQNKLDNESVAEMNNIFNKYYTELNKELRNTSEAIIFQKASAVEKSQDFIGKWSDLYNEFMKELIRTPGFNIILNANLLQELESKNQLDEALENHWKVLGLPTRTDIMDLHRTLHDLNLKLNTISKKLKSIDIKKPK
jgi:hypothetical protein